MIAAVAWVLIPLFRGESAALPLYSGAAPAAQQDLLYQKKIAGDIIKDLQFDLQTGKLSPEDHSALSAEQQRLIASLDERLGRLQGATRDEMTVRLEEEITRARARL